MLRSITINNILLVSSMTVNLENGLCSITGETGAGKSIILGSISFVLGNRSSGHLLREGESTASVIAEFDISHNHVVKAYLEEQAIDFDDSLIIRRVVYADGRNKAFINDTPVSVSSLKAVGYSLVEIHGQHEQKGLLNQSEHLTILDEYAIADKQKNIVKKSYYKYKELKGKLNSLIEHQDKLKKEEEYLRYTYDELTSLNPISTEEEELSAKRRELMNQEKFIKTVGSTLSELKGKNDPLSSIRSASRVLIRSNIDEEGKFDAAIEALDRAEIEVIEAVRAVEDILNDCNNESLPLDQVEERLFSLRAAARKYNCSVDKLPEYVEEIARKIKEIEKYDNDLSDLKRSIENAREFYINSSLKLSEIRVKAASKLSESIINELKPLKMEKTNFVINIEKQEEENWSENGFDKVKFLASMNPGNPAGALHKIASGGELSRFMLAFKVVLSEVKAFPTMIFDEVDTGIGGAVADAVGKRLDILANNRQILVVTHQPQVAAKADAHYKVIKYQQENNTYTTLKQLNDFERKEEIARMLSGEVITDEARAAADSLISM